MDSTALQPIPQQQRRLTRLDLSLVWFGAAIAITEIWAGGLPGLSGLGLGAGLLAIILGRLVGNGLMAAMAHTGAVSGLPTMVLTRPVFGSRGSWLPSFFNVLQLIGWTGFMLFVGAGYLDSLAAALGLPTIAQAPAMQWLWVSLQAALCIAWALLFGGSPVWKWVERISGLLLLLLSLAMTVLVLRSYDLSSLWHAGVATPLGILAGMDLVIAMSVSWLPLVADYSRYARSPREGASGTFWGYFIGGSWMYAVGLLVALAAQALHGAQAASPDSVVIDLMGGAGTAWGILAIALVLLSTVTTTFLDIYSTTISAQNLWPRLPEKSGHVVGGLLGAMLALGLSTEAYEPFLLAIGAIFLPAFCVVLADYWLRRRDCSYPAGSLPAFRWPALLAWLAGFLVYDWASGWPSLLCFTAKLGFNPATHAWPSGASLPCILVSVASYLLLAGLEKRPNRSLDSNP